MKTKKIRFSFLIPLFLPLLPLFSRRGPALLEGSVWRITFHDHLFGMTLHRRGEDILQVSLRLASQKPDQQRFKEKGFRK